MAEINNDDFPSNSIKKRGARVPTRNVEKSPGEKIEKKSIKPLNVSTRIKKESFLQKVGNTFFSSTGDSVLHYIFVDVLLPAAKDTLTDVVTKGIELLLYGESRDYRRSRGRGTVISYGNMYREQRAKPRQQPLLAPGRRSKTRLVTFEDQGEAGEVLEFLMDLIDKYGQASVADFYEVSGLTEYSDFTDNSYGWSNLSGTRIVRTRDGYEIDFSEPRRLD